MNQNLRCHSDIFVIIVTGWGPFFFHHEFADKHDKMLDLQAIVSPPPCLCFEGFYFFSNGQDFPFAMIALSFSKEGHLPERPWSNLQRSWDDNTHGVYGSLTSLLTEMYWFNKTETNLNNIEMKILTIQWIT